MSDRSTGSSAMVSPDVRISYLQRKLTSMLRRADARESALESALEHTRASEAQLRTLLEQERSRHTIENRLLRDRLQRLEQCLLSFVSTGGRILKAPLAALRSSNPAGLGAPTGARALPASTVSAANTQLPAPTQFDPAALVASMLPLAQVHDGGPQADVGGALGRLQEVVQTADAHRTGEDRSPIAPAAEPTVSPTYAQVRPGEEVPREECSACEEAASTHDAPWFPRAFKRLAEEDPEAAGRLFLQLLPAQALAWPEDVAYQIDVSETGTLAVEVRGGHCTVRPLLGPDDVEATGEQTLRTDLAGLSRTVAARRGWSRVGARLAGGRNRHLRALRALGGAPLQLSDIKRSQARLDPMLLLRLMALAIDPAWTAQEIFTVACRWHGRVAAGCYIHVFENAPVAVTTMPPLGRMAATLTCDPQDVLDILLGNIALDDPRAQVGGNRAVLVSLLEWFTRVDATATMIRAESPAEALTA